MATRKRTWTLKLPAIGMVAPPSNVPSIAERRTSGVQAKAAMAMPIRTAPPGPGQMPSLRAIR